MASYFGLDASMANGDLDFWVDRQEDLHDNDEIYAVVADGLAVFLSKEDLRRLPSVVYVSLQDGRRAPPATTTVDVDCKHVHNVGVLVFVAIDDIPSRPMEATKRGLFVDLSQA